MAAKLKPKPKKKKRRLGIVWKTKEGREILLSTMEEDHLMNCYAMMLRKRDTAIAWCAVLRSELVHRARGLDIFHDDDADNGMSRFPPF